ncbi:MAG: hypothetical protein WBN11_04685 [Eudoraea sp.]|uniref:hypothetical protein n=1 Tax=Eudoraea sp. TaxID=1979955 RepID=UPI003C744849
MSKKIVFIILCLVVVTTYGQNSSVSPYSYHGIGDIRAQSTVENQSMGGLGMYTDSIHTNLKNPAAYGKLRLVNYTIAGGHSEIRMTDFTASQQTSVTSLEYIAIGIPLTPKLGIGIGVLPYTSMGYNTFSDNISARQDTIANQYGGEGGLNKVFLSAGYEITKNFHLGATVNYSFGSLEYRSVQNIAGVQYGVVNTKFSQIKGFDFNYAATYTPKIKGRFTLFSSITVNTQANLVSQNEETLGSFSTITGEVIEGRDVNLDAQNLKNTELKIPTTTTLGLGFGRDKRWFLGAEYSLQGLSSFRNEFVDQNNIIYEDATTIAIGGYIVPDYASFTSYAKRVNYRFGGRYENTGMIINGKEINDYGITFGLGFPLGSGFDNINLGLTYGIRGTATANLVEESYFKVNIGLSFNDKWFQKRKIN